MAQQAKSSMSALLVHPDENLRQSIARVMETFSFRVMQVESGFKALSLLWQRKEKVDVMLLDMHVPDMNPFDLVRLTVNDMNLPTLLMSTDDNDNNLETRALENGAGFFLTNTITTEMVQYLLKYLRMEKIVRHEKGKRTVEEDDGPASKRDKTEKSAENDEENEPEENSCSIKKKPATKWTPELHQKFLGASIQLGDGKCFPKEVHKLMNVPDLTVEQVGSHLQVCRNMVWGDPSVSRHHGRPRLSSSSSMNGPRPRMTARKSGVMPLIPGQSSASAQETQDNGRAPQFNSPPPPPSSNATFVANEGRETYRAPQVPFSSYPSLPGSFMSQTGAQGVLNSLPAMGTPTHPVENTFDYGRWNLMLENPANFMAQGHPVEGFLDYTDPNEIVPRFVDKQMDMNPHNKTGGQ